MDYLQDLGSSLTGSINKAMLLVKKNDKDTMKISELRDKLVDISDVSVINNPKGVLKAAQRYNKVKSIAGSDFYVMQLKYNPSSIRFSSQAGSYVQSGPGNAGVNQITQITVPSRTTMYVDLIFDDVSVMDSFMWDKFHLGINSTVTATAGGIKQATKNGYSVQTQMEGLISLIIYEYSRNVIFYWSEMAFAGEVTGVSATYTMFNPQGHPVRGKISLTIFQSEESNNTSGGEYWDSAFDRLFNDYSHDSDVEDTRIINQLGNIINI